MKAQRIGFLTAALAVVTFSGCVVEGPPPPRVSARVEVGAGVTFYEPLAPHGYWVEVPSYGRCWYPARVEAGWRPYVSGHWVWTEAGWYWASDEPWAWATYHYGRWTFTGRYGWVWAPGGVWGPSWVCWREGGGYIGWAPLSPESRFGASGALIIEERFIAPTSFVFVETHRVSEPIRPSVVVYSPTIIQKTVNITDIKQVNNTVIVQGPKVEAIERVSARKVPTARVTELRVREEKQAKPEKEKSAKPTEVKEKPAPPPRETAKPAKTEAVKPKKPTEAKPPAEKPAPPETATQTKSKEKPAAEAKPEKAKPAKPAKEEKAKAEKEKADKKKKPAEEEQQEKK